jgi:hypothetical protein
MKLTIGDKYKRSTDNYKEELEIVGCNASWLSNAQLSKGDVFCPNKEDMIEVRIINSVSCEFFHTEISLKNLVNRWNKK